MAHLLGSEYCIESLSRDVNDIQVTLADIGSRIGQIRCQSWKYPDKSSVDVDVNSILQDCRFNCDDVDDNQVAHVTLYDLMIDRLLFLLQSFTHFNEILLSIKSASPNKPPHDGGRSMSAGLTTRRCWSRVSQIATVMQQMAKEVQKQKKMLMSPSTNDEGESEESVKKSQVFVKAPGVSIEISRGISHQCSQTPETLFSTCEVCSRAQHCLHDVGRSIVKLCKSQSLPTSLEDYADKQSIGNLMSIVELTRWKNLQNKDLSRIDRQLESLMKQIKPLKRENADSAKREEDLKKEIERLGVIAERRERDFDEEKRKIEFKNKETDKSLRTQLTQLTNEAAKLNEMNKILTTQLKDVKDELLQKHRVVLSLETSKSQLKEEVSEGRGHKEDAVRMRGEVNHIRMRMEELQEQLRTSEAKLDEQMRLNKTLENHSNAAQMKQKNLVQRLEELDEECERLREQSSSWENEREKDEERVGVDRRKWEEMEKELRKQKEVVKILEDEKSLLERSVSDLRGDVNAMRDELERCRENERLMVAYPDLHHMESPILQSSGDVIIDMQRQVEANDIRIGVLEKENKVLLKTISKVPNSGNSPPESIPTERSDFSIQPVQLWRTEENRESPYNYRSKLNTRSRATLTPSKSEIGSNNNKKETEVRSSFHVGPGKRRSVTPTSSRSALVKPWT